MKHTGTKALYLKLIRWSLCLGIVLSWNVVSHAQSAPADGIGMVWGSAADLDRPAALRLNPAGLSFVPSWGLQYIHSDRGQPFNGSGLGDGDALFVSFKPLSFLGLGLGLQLLYPMPQDAQGQQLGMHARFTLGSSIRMGRWFSVGLNVHGFLSEQAELQQVGLFDVGLTWRPFNLISLGLVMRNLNTPKWGSSFIARKWEFALALRPLLTDRWVVSVDVQLPEKGAPATFQYRTEFEPLDGWVIGLRAGHDIGFKNVHMDAFLGFRFGHWGLQASGRGLIDSTGSNSQFRAEGFTASLWYSQKAYRPLVKGSRKMPLLDLSGRLAERVNDFPLGGVKPLFMRVLFALDRVARDPSVGALMLRLGAIQCGMAKVQELRAAIRRIQKRGKKVFVYLTAASMKTFYLASLADRVYIYPNGSIQMAGLSFRHIFYAGLFEKIGVKAQFVKFGKYKTGPNQYTEKHMTPAQKEAYKALLDDVYTQLLKGVAKGRKKTQKHVSQWIRHGWFTAKEAEKSGLVDKRLHWSKVLPELHRSVDRTLRFDVDYFSDKTVRSRWKGNDRIAVIHVDGAIVSGRGLDDPIFGTRLSGAHALIQYIVRAQFDSSIRGVVLRIDSPGGGVLASDMLWRYVGQLSRVKPVVVSMATVAASGGYYIAAPATEIFAMPATITGSIGIYAGKFDFSSLLKKLGVHIQFQQRGPLAGFFSPYRPFSPAQLKRLQSYIRAGYTSFLEKVFAGRKRRLKTMKKLRSVAAGRIWSGVRAQKHGLVDRIGGLWDAVQHVRMLTGMPPVTSKHLVSWPDKGMWNISPRLALGIRAKKTADPLAQLFAWMSKRTNSQVSVGAFFTQWLQQWKTLYKQLQKTQMWALQPHLLYTP